MIERLLIIILIVIIAIQLAGNRVVIGGNSDDSRPAAYWDGEGIPPAGGEHCLRRGVDDNGNVYMLAFQRADASVPYRLVKDIGPYRRGTTIDLIFADGAC